MEHTHLVKGLDYALLHKVWICIIFFSFSSGYKHTKVTNSSQCVTRNIKFMYRQQALCTTTLWPNRWFTVA